MKRANSSGLEGFCKNKVGLMPHIMASQYITGFTRPHCVLDIGSNSVRLVVYRGRLRSPTIIFNEKIIAGLGQGVQENGEIHSDNFDRAMRAIRRYWAICESMGVGQRRCIATAAVREASNRKKFVKAVQKIGFEPQILSGEDEARYGALGVLSAIPDAHGLVGDLGGGSLELSYLKSPKVKHVISFPLGVIKVKALREEGDSYATRVVDDMLGKADWLSKARGQPLYLVGGSWRAIMRLNMRLSGDEHQIIQQYNLSSSALPFLLKSVTAMLKSGDERALKAVAVARRGQLTDAIWLLQHLSERLDIKVFIGSAYGLREGILYDELDEWTRRADPFLDTAFAFGEEYGRFPDFGLALAKWVAPLFSDDNDKAARLREGAAYLTDIAWRANPSYRAERAVEIALHGDWIGITADERELVAQALYTALGAGVRPFPLNRIGAGKAAMERAFQWGLAMRMGHRLSAGVGSILEQCPIECDGDNLVLELSQMNKEIYGTPIKARHYQLARAMGLKNKVRVG